MEEVEKFFKCPYCFEKISMLIDVSSDGPSLYVEDCEVCCHPIQIQYQVAEEKISGFRAEKAF